jgi:hypothetical protein
MTSGELPAEFGMAWIGVGVLRLRKTFASRRSCCAQDDSSLRMTGLWSMRSYAPLRMKTDLRCFLEGGDRILLGLGWWHLENSLLSSGWRR